MKRADLLDAIYDLKNSENVERDIDALKNIADDFCDHYETDFNNIEEFLSSSGPHTEHTNKAFEVAQKCSRDLY